MKDFKYAEWSKRVILENKAAWLLQCHIPLGDGMGPSGR